MNMGSFFAILLVIIGVVLAICFVSDICTSSARKINRELLKREYLLYEEDIKADLAKQRARIMGEIVRENIERIARQNERTK